MIRVSFQPLTLSCTCQAGQSGIPCKHRIQILQGSSTDAIAISQNKESALLAIKEIANNSNVFELLDEYEAVKKEIKEIDANSEKLFKKYRDALTEFRLEKAKTDRKVVKAKSDLDSILEKGIEIAVEKEKILKRLRTVFILPDR
jgi:hypothetical protein